MLTVAVRLPGGYGGWRRAWGSTVMVQIYRIIVVGLLCSLVLLASVERTPYEVNTFTSNKEGPLLRSAYNCLCAQETPIVLRRFANQMSSKTSDNNEERYKSLGFERCFDGSAGGLQWSDLIEGLKTNVLRQDLRVRKLILGEYDTKSGDRDLAKVPEPLPADWTPTVQRQVSTVLQSERKADLIHKGKSASEIEKDTGTTLFKAEFEKGEKAYSKHTLKKKLLKEASSSSSGRQRSVVVVAVVVAASGPPDFGRTITRCNKHFSPSLVSPSRSAGRNSSE